LKPYNTLATTQTPRKNSFVVMDIDLRKVTAILDGIVACTSGMKTFAKMTTMASAFRHLLNNSTWYFGSSQLY